jgi:hypothetical protein
MDNHTTQQKRKAETMTDNTYTMKVPGISRPADGAYFLHFNCRKTWQQAHDLLTALNYADDGTEMTTGDTAPADTAYISSGDEAADGMYFLKFENAAAWAHASQALRLMDFKTVGGTTTAGKAVMR